MGVGLGVVVGVAVGVGVTLGVGVAVGVPVGVTVGVAVGVPLGVTLGVAVGVAVKPHVHTLEIDGAPNEAASKNAIDVSDYVEVVGNFTVNSGGCPQLARTVG